MGGCLVLFISAWSFVRLWSVPAAVAMCVVAMVIPPIAAMVGNARGKDDRWWDETCGDPKSDEWWDELDGRTSGRKDGRGGDDPGDGRGGHGSRDRHEGW